MTAASVSTDRDKLLILAAICLAALVLPLSFTGGAVATPAIGRELGGGPAALTWITNAFMLSFGSLLMAAGALADQYGRKRLFSLGMGLFSLSSAALAAAPGVAWIDGLRAVQGIAAAAALSSGSAALAQEFEGHARARAFSLLGTTFGIGLAFGPLAAGGLIEAFGWRAVFVATAALGALALAFCLWRMRETRDPHARGLDWPGTLTFSGSLALFTSGVIQAPESGWSSPLVGGLLAASALLLAAFIRFELRAARPMLDLTLFRYARFVGVQMLPLGTCFCYIVLVVLLPLRLIGIEGLSEIRAGWLMVALSAPMLVVPMLAAVLARRVSARALSTLGFVIAAAGLLWLSRIGTGSPAALVAPMLLIGLGAGLPWGLMDGLAVSVVPKERAGMAAGIFNTSRVAGEGLTLAVVNAILAALTLAGLPAAPPAARAEAAQRLAAGDLAHAAATLPGVARATLLRGYDGAFVHLLYVLIAVTLIAALTVWLCLRPARPAAARRLAPDAPGS